MRPRPGKPYYTAYEERYRSVYGQGVTYWSAYPEELAAVRGDVDSFLTDLGLTPPALAPGAPAAHVAEFGCGEGFAGVLLAERGFRYTGLDIAESAVSKARARLARFGRSAEARLADLTDLRDIPRQASLTSAGPCRRTGTGSRSESASNRGGWTRCLIAGSPSNWPGSSGTGMPSRAWPPVTDRWPDRGRSVLP